MHYTPASLWKRLFATIYDALILTAVSLLYGAIATLISTWVFGNEASEFRPNVNSYVFFMGWILTLLGFYLFFWMKVGQTVAMKAWRLKLFNEDGTQPKLKACLVRALLGFASIACFGLGYFWAIFDKEKCALHDRLSGTRVVQLSKEEA